MVDRTGHGVLIDYHLAVAYDRPDHDHIFKTRSTARDVYRRAGACLEDEVIIWQIVRLRQLIVDRHPCRVRSIMTLLRHGGESRVGAGSSGPDMSQGHSPRAALVVLVAL
ncbi:BZ3500_MvSof-1268-A1-R1_Chr10-2g03016 [Microbotryum saponariae]|uniref:BZ3500_MvSof-1268-A1-R1_Chr10-2g03016 protein n=1 Tax=Microbotryum saponariae TaxID=289078 RepID=A0A2X0LGV4_9BASI|nr:BZ3501_MvSof-1269-A2-R1_Chr10-2g02602 [Microbotryum saponariae]SCZ97839.1 BZ3500_MvSof-1268-A1-R1_Chr3-3g06403 [Microbotryum saponariae]SDA01930.1 BZ3500_MvSof-1268-A1-R1_Chr10-2g03016 [Microbotryum saponariae]SDA04370.1 BZ3501_MvSof-1269-A2-R1_Chr3-2g06090 [Microbotryum saponariae]